MAVLYDLLTVNDGQVYPLWAAEDQGRQWIVEGPGVVQPVGAQGERCAQWLHKGRQVAIEGRLRWSQWETQDGQKRSKLSVVAEGFQFVGPREGGPSRGQGGYDQGVGAQAPDPGQDARPPESPAADASPPSGSDIPF